MSYPDDKERYKQAKLAALIGVNYVKDYNDNKNAVVKTIYGELFTQLDELLPPLLLNGN